MSLPRISMMLSACAVILMTTGCADDTFDISSNSSERDIRFEVRVNDTWNQGEGTSRSTLSTLEPVVLTGESCRLYLVPSQDEWTEEKSRGNLIEDDGLEAFGVFASIAGTGSGPDYMYNEEVTSKNDWAPVDQYMWPGLGQLHINAYAPYVGEAKAEGITSLPSVSGSGHLKLSYKVPANVGEHEDLMWSTPREASSSPCELTFNHALTAIRFSAGSSLPPCTIKEISIKNVLDKGTLDLETGEWSDTTGNATYTIAPKTTLTAADGEKYVTPGTPIADGDNTFIILPQTLGENASLSVTIDMGGTVKVLEASLYGQQWEAGKELNYRLSTTPDQQTLELDVTGSFHSNYYLGTDNFTVKSRLIDGESTTPVKWIAEFVDDEGNVIERPQWIVDFTTSGNGDTDCSATTRLQDPDFLHLSEESQALQNAADINTSSGHTPYNLASASGNATVENTANCYVINAPGKYSIPLVYGNAIKDGATNSAAYTSTSHNRYALKTFVNHLNNGITDPYIYNNAGCTPASAKLLWEAELNLVQNVALSDDHKCLTFDVPHSTIRQGNAVVAVLDSNGAVMWSWHIWVTDYVAGSGTVAVSLSGKEYAIYARCLGQVNGGDITDFKPRSVKVRFSQTDVPNGLTPLQKTLEFTQNGITITKGDRYTYYQWGRKDPMVPNADEWYDSMHQEIHTLTQMSVASDVPSGMSLMQYWTLDPQAFWSASHDHKFSYTNLWNTNLSTTAPQKTVYDPSPVGSIMPMRSVFREVIDKGSLTFSSSETAGARAGFYITTADGALWFAPLGYRSGTTGLTTNSGTVGEYWCSESVNTAEAAALVLKASGPSMKVEQESRTHAFGVRPMLE